MKKLFTLLSIAFIYFNLFSTSAVAQKESQWSASYKAGYASDGGSLSLSNLTHNFELSRDFSGAKGVAGISYDNNFTNSAIYIGSEIGLIKKGKIDWGILGNIGTTTGNSKVGFFNYGWWASYALSNHFSLESQIKNNYYNSANTFVTGNFGFVYKFASASPKK